MAIYKQSTEQIIQKIKEIEHYLASQEYKDVVSANDISSLSSPYRNGDQTFSDSIDLLKIALKKINGNLALVDKIDQNMRVNFLSYLTNLQVWLISGPIVNWNNILSYANTIYQWIYQWGIATSEQTLSKKVLQNLGRLDIKDEEIKSLQNLRTSLEEVVSAGENIQQAKELLEYVKKEQPISALDLYLKNTKETIDSTLKLVHESTQNTYLSLGKLETEANKKISNILGKTSDAVTTVHFREVRDSYRSELLGSRNSNDSWIVKLAKFAFTGWSRYFFWTLIFFAFNLILVIFFNEKISISADSFKDEYVRLIANGTIRITCLAPSIFLLGFVFNNYYSSRRMMRIYEEREVTSRVVEGHIAILQQRDIHPDIINHVVKSMYGIMFDKTCNQDVKDSEVKPETGIIMIDKITDLFDKLNKPN